MDKVKSIQEVESGELPAVSDLDVKRNHQAFGRDISGGDLHEGEDGGGHDGEPG